MFILLAPRLLINQVIVILSAGENICLYVCVSTLMGPLHATFLIAQL